MNLKDLLEIANTKAQALKDAPPAPVYKSNSVLEFIKQFKISEGKRKVKLPMIYKAYESWDANPMPKPNFEKYWGQVFVRNPNGYYTLNIRPIELLNKVQYEKTK